jgi:KTSC domain
MNRVPVSSSNLASVAYDPSSEILEVEFKNQTIYQYYNVPQFMHEQLMQAPSIGAFFNANVRNAYACSRV